MKNRKYLHNEQSRPARWAAILILALAVGCNSSGDSEQGEEMEPTERFSASMVEDVMNEEVVRELRAERQILEESISESRRNAITNAVEQASPAIVNITVSGEMERRGVTLEEEILRLFSGQVPMQDFTNMASGFIISEDGLVVTNQHVIGSNAREIVITTTEGTRYQARQIGGDELTDIALLQIQSDEPFSYVEFSDSDEVIVGEWAIAVGNPFALFEDGQPAVTLGVVSAKNRDFRPDPNNPRVYLDMIQTDASINSGNSGGPLLNSEGKVIGVNTFIYTGGQSGGNIGIGFAIPSNRVEKIINQLLTTGRVLLDFDPGMEFETVDLPHITQYRIPPEPGLFITSINRDGPAFESGVMPGDVIYKIGSERVLSEMHGWALMREYDEGDTMRLELSRDGELYRTEMLLRKRALIEEEDVEGPD